MSSASDDTEQAEVLRFLAEPGHHGAGVDRVERIETHGAYVFLAGDSAIKIKRAVSFSYMDFSTLALRETAIRHELAVNREAAPGIYRDVVPITRDTDGGLRWAGTGEVVEWALRMRRFAQSELLSARIDAGHYDQSLLQRLADVVAASHGRAGVMRPKGQVARLDRIAGDICHVLHNAAGGDVALAAEVDRLGVSLRNQVRRWASLIEARAQAGFVRRCHGDLHLDNVVVLAEQPVLFDAIEFSEEIATVDILYDLAFLLMDLCHRGQISSANAVLNRYLWRDACDATLEGLSLLALFIGLRAGIRAMVSAQRATQSHDDGGDLARAYVATAMAALAPFEPRLVAVGGLSGSGKSTLAARVAPLLGSMPGAVHLRSDLERKTLAGVNDDTRLPPTAYTRDAGVRVYRRLLDRAERALRAGRCVVVDAVFANEAERQSVADVAARAGVRFDGLWLTAERETLLDRVASRRGDASDATAAVVMQQFERELGPVTWTIVDSSGSPDVVLDHTKILLELDETPPEAISGP